jgi:two-component system OmpR family response regulator
MRILVAEDDAALASFVKKGLESEHYAVDVSTDGEEARAMAGELDFDLVVLDLNLPQLDGVAILRFLRTRKPSMPILVLIGRTRVKDLVLCLDLGADDYLGKPFSFTELSARIRALMRRSHTNKSFVFYQQDGWNTRIGCRRGRNESRTRGIFVVWICQMQEFHPARAYASVLPTVC